MPSFPLIETRAIMPADHAAFEARAWDDFERHGGGLQTIAPGAPSTKGFSPLEEAILRGGWAATQSGEFIDPVKALGVAAVYACRRVIAEDIAKMPRAVVRRRHDGGSGATRTEVLRDHPVHKLLTRRPNDWMTPFSFMEYMVGTAALHGRSYALKTTIAENRRPGDYAPVTGEIVELLPLLPGAVSVVQNADWAVEYHVSGYGDSFVASPGQIVVIDGPLQDPLVGLSTYQYAREAISLAASVERAASRFHANDLRPSGILTTKMPVKAELASRIAQDWKAKYGPGGEGGIAVLDNDFAFTSLNATAADSQTIENRKFQIEEICRYFRVFPTAIGHNSGSQSYSSIEQFMQAHVTHTLMPWVERIEQALMRDLLGHDDPDVSVQIDMDWLNRGTLTDRVGAYDRAVRIYMTPNEVRVREGLDPIDDAIMDRVQLQANNTGLTPGAKPGAAADPAASKKPPADAATSKNPTDAKPLSKPAADSPAMPGGS